MKKEIFYADFDVCEVTRKINDVMSRWATHLIVIRGQNWQVYNYSNEIIYEFHFLIDFKNVESRIKLEDLRLNVIHHIESMRDDTDFVDSLVIPELLY